MSGARAFRVRIRLTTRTPLLALFVPLLLLSPVASASADVRQNAACHLSQGPPPVSACATATLAGTLVGCAGTTCQAAFTLDLEVDGVGRCAAASATVTMPTIAECDGLFEAATATGTVSFAQGDAVVVRGLVCVGLPTLSQTCVTYEETFAF